MLLRGNLANQATSVEKLSQKSKPMTLSPVTSDAYLNQLRLAQQFMMGQPEVNGESSESYDQNAFANRFQESIA